MPFQPSCASNYISSYVHNYRKLHRQESLIYQFLRTEITWCHRRDDHNIIFHYIQNIKSRSRKQTQYCVFNKKYPLRPTSCLLYIPGAGDGVFTKPNPLTFGVSECISSLPSTPIFPSKACA